MKKVLLALLTIATLPSFADRLLIPMDSSQTNHLKAYGGVYYALQQKLNVQWLLNHKGGSWLTDAAEDLEEWLRVRNVTFTTYSDADSKTLLDDLKNETGAAAITMQVMPKIGVYAPSWKETAYDDAVVLALNYAEIPYEKIYDTDVLKSDLKKFDFIHLHHEDFTGQYGRFWMGYHNVDWYKQDVANNEALALQLGYAKVSQMKLAVVKKLNEWISNGGHLFAMCSATDSYDIALAADGVDICAKVFDGDDADPAMNSKLNYSNCLAFENFKVSTNYEEYEFSDIDSYGTRSQRGVNEKNDFFTLQQYDGQTQPDLAMLSQSQTTKIKGFWGMTTGFGRSYLKPDAQVMAYCPVNNEARYIHGNLGKGGWTFYAGHDPEDYQHRTGEPASDLSKHQNSPGYRLILNNVMRASVRGDLTNPTFSCSVYPNPAANGQATISATISQKENVTMTMYALDGQIVKSEQLGEQEGTFTYSLSLTGVAAGLYQVELTAGTVSKRVKLVVQ